MRRILKFGIFGAALLSGCGSVHPVVTAQYEANVAMILITGGGFSDTNPCASVALVGYPQPGTITSINKQVACSSGSIAAFAWPLPVATCPSATNSTIQAAVLAVDIKTFDPASAMVSLPCNQPPPCPPSLQGSALPAANWSASSAAPGYYAHQSAILNSHNGSPIATNPSLSDIEKALGGIGAFNAATFHVPNGTNGYGTGGGLPAGVISCSYDSPGFTYDKQPAIAQVTIACTASCGAL